MRRTSDGSKRTVHLSGVISLADSARLWQELAHMADSPVTRVELDLSGLERLDGAGAAMLHALACDACCENVAVEFAGAHGEVARLLGLYTPPVAGTCLKDAPRTESMLAHLGRSTVSCVCTMLDVLSFTGALFASGFRVSRHPSSLPWRSIPGLVERAGADGAPIVLLISFLIGLIMALQAEPQLSRFGANLFVADLVGLSIVRELGPLMTAIVVAGRSGAAYAAELGTMRVSEEIDAMRTLGLDPMRYLVFPRVVALAIAVPFLTLAADVVGIAGGWLMSITGLGLTTVQYVTELEKALHLTDVFGGILKSFAFAIVIALIACQRGLATRGGAAEVGRSTTSAVVTVLFSLVAFDAVFTWLYYMFFGI